MTRLKPSVDKWTVRMNCKLFRTEFPELLSGKGKQPDRSTCSDKIRKYRQILAQRLIALGFKPDKQYTRYTLGREGEPFVMVELTGYDKQMKPLYKVCEPLFAEWMADWA